MKQTPNGDSDTNSLQHQSGKQPVDIYRPQLWPAVVTTAAVLLVGGSGVGFLIWASAVFTDTAAAVSFVAQNTLSLFVLLAVVVQGCIYWSQRGLMYEQLRMTENALQIGQRAYVGVQKIEWDRDATSHTVLIEIANSGNIPASEIDIAIQIMTYIPPKRAEHIPHVKGGFSTYAVHAYYGSTKLFRGNLPILINLRLEKLLPEQDILLIRQVHGFIAILGAIAYADGFDTQTTDFMYTYQGGLMWTPTAPDEWKRRVEEMAKTEQENPT